MNRENAMLKALKFPMVTRENTLLKNICFAEAWAAFIEAKAKEAAKRLEAEAENK